MAFSILIAGTGILLGFALYMWKKVDVEALTQKMGKLYDLSFNKYYFDEMYDATFIKGTLAWNNFLSWFDQTIIDGLVNLSAWITRNVSSVSGIFDNGIIDGAVNGVADLTQDFGKYLRRVQTGQVQTYIFAALLGAIAIIVVSLL